MKHIKWFTGRALLSLAAGVASYLSIANAEVQPGQVLIQAVQGSATYSTGDQPLALKENLVLSRGTVLRTGKDATVDLILQYNGTVLRLMPNSTLSFDKLNKENAGENIITETSLNLSSGIIFGSQRKLAIPSTFEVKTPNGVASIKGTEYYVRADGAVSVISGSVQVAYNLPGNGGSIKVTVAAGYYFDPTTGSVVPGTFMTGDHKGNSAMTYKFNGTTVVVKPEGTITKTKGNNGVGNGIDPAPPGDPPINDGPGTGPGNPGNRGGTPSPRHP